jgi:hypothetical protein
MKRLIKPAVIILVTYLAWWSWKTFSASEQEQMLIVQQRFITAVEDRDWGTINNLISTDYADEWGHEKATVIPQMKELLGAFFFLSITPKVERSQVAKGLGMVVTQLKAEGNGAGFSTAVVSQLNSLRTPWYFHWHKRGRWPWSWELVQVHNDGLK